MNTIFFVICFTIAGLSSCSRAVGETYQRKPRTVEVLAEKAEVYMSVAVAPRPSTSVPVYLASVPAASVPFAVQVQIAEITEKDSTAQFPEDPEQDPLSQSKKSANRVRSFIRLILSNIKASQQNLILEIASEIAYENERTYRRSTWTSDSSRERLTIIHNPGRYAQKYTQLVTERIHVRAITPGAIVIVDSPGFYARTGTAYNKATKIESVRVKISDPNDTILYRGAWPAKLMQELMLPAANKVPVSTSPPANVPNLFLYSISADSDQTVVPKLDYVGTIQMWEFRVKYKRVNTTATPYKSLPFRTVIAIDAETENTKETETIQAIVRADSYGKRPEDTIATAFPLNTRRLSGTGFATIYLIDGIVTNNLSPISNTIQIPISTDKNKARR